LEAHGCHVPAYRGGTLGDIDLFAWNETTGPIDLDGLRVGVGEKISLQIKRWAIDKRREKTVDYLIGSGVKGPRAFNENWILNQVRQCPTVLNWMLRSLDWLPEWFLNLEQFGLRKGSAERTVGVGQVTIPRTTGRQIPPSPAQKPIVSF
jgi:hypothetical protein